MYVMAERVCYAYFVRLFCEMMEVKSSLKIAKKKFVDKIKEILTTESQQNTSQRPPQADYHCEYHT